MPDPTPPQSRDLSLPQAAATARASTTAGDVLRSLTLAQPVRSLYIHIPFCAHKCHYCDFYSLVDTQDRQLAFTNRLLRELAALAPLAHGSPLRTIFIGGGTPSLLGLPHWERLLATLDSHFDLADIRDGQGEFTVECNPESASPELMRLLRSGGVTRVSLGAQSFDPAMLKALERWHDPANVARALDAARAAGIERQSLDLIHAIPGQTIEGVESDLHTALDLGVSHLSSYSLTYEPGTALTARLKKGLVSRLDDDLEADMFERTLDILRTRGFERYEVSNFAMPGRECRHNLAYWRQEQWLAAGPSASAHVAGARWKNTPRLDDYLSGGDESGFAQVQDVESPDERRLLGELLWTGLRTREGVHACEMLRRARALGCAQSVSSVVASAIRRGLLHDDPETWHATDAGFLVADALAVEMLGAVGG